MPPYSTPILCLTLAVLHLTAGLPVQTKGQVRIADDSSPDNDVVKQFSSDSSQDPTMEKTVKDIFNELDNLEIKALYQKQVTLEKLENDTQLMTKLPSPAVLKYKVTRKEDIYFFAVPSKNVASVLTKDGDAGVSRQGTPPLKDPDSHQARSKAADNQDLLQPFFGVAKKHTNNPPGWGSRSRSLSSSGNRYAKKRLEHSMLTKALNKEFLSDKSTKMEGVSEEALRNLLTSLQRYMKDRNSDFS